MENLHRRMVAVAITFEFFAELITIGNEFHAQVVEGLPEGAKFIESYTVARQGCGYLVFQHESFAPVPEGAEIPLLNPVLRKFDCSRLSAGGSGVELQA